MKYGCALKKILKLFVLELRVDMLFAQCIHNDRIIEDVHIGKAFCSYDASYKDVVDGKEQIVGAFAGNFLFRTSDYLYIRGNMDGEKGKHIMKFFIS